MTVKICKWCRAPFTPRTSGGKSQQFCLDKCRREYEAIGRAWLREELASEAFLQTLRNWALCREAILVSRSASSGKKLRK